VVPVQLQLLVPLTVLVVPQLLVWVRVVPEQTVLVSGDQEDEDTVQQAPLKQKLSLKHSSFTQLLT
jgi:hypothetical protein